MTTTSSPSAALTCLYEVDKAAAISVALLWSNCDINGSADDQEKYKAARTLARAQDLVHNCPLCAWPLLVSKNHPFCDDQHLADLLNSLCFEPGCYEPQTTSDYSCDKHTDCKHCGEPLSDCQAGCAYYDELEENLREHNEDQAMYY